MKEATAAFIIFWLMMLIGLATYFTHIYNTIGA